MLGILGLAFLSLVVGAVLGAVAWERHPDMALEGIHRRLRILWPLSLAVLALGVAALAGLAQDRLGERYPLWAQRHLAEALSLSMLALFGTLGGLAAVFALLSAHPKRGRLMFAVALIELVLFGSACRWTLPVELADEPRVNADGVVLQTSGSSCAAASLANLARRAGRELSERQAAELLGTKLSGTFPGQIRYALAELGFEFETVRLESPERVALEAPALLFVDHPATGRESHAVAYFGRRESDGRHEIFDPLRGRVFFDDERLRRVWHGFAIACRPVAGADSAAHD